ncbi:polysaccharide biosynthesis C-terminal domain-containing protein [Chloroflexus sp.]|uniref:polysaccharide biosynthesis C-terminal domain-containing protein n=1 Tax=Chloroflexus sp. TaxID=1904827 RepID=UPI00298EE295|nr:polysaccharide biosynthesis C-terminal domain-containing protein [Chloroflexus sp.]MDW8403075.1 polysaccharide biosynthesis C-terminal domain-containing protein [Chloroflexus sp.]
MTAQRPSLATQVSRAVWWNTLFAPLRLLAEVIATLIKLNQLSQAGFGLLALVRGASNLFGTALDLGIARALPKYIPETERSGGARAARRLFLLVATLQLAILLVIALGLALSHRQIERYLQGLLGGEVAVEAAARAELSQFVAEFHWLIIAAIVILLGLGALYDLLMAVLSSFFRQKAWNSIALAAGLLPQILVVVAILALPDRWDILGVLVAMVLAPAIAVALAGWQVWRLQAGLEMEPGPGLLADLRDAVRDLRRALPPGFARYAAVSYLMTATDFIASFEFINFFNSDIRDVSLLAAGALLVRMALSYLYTPMVGVQVPLFTRVRQGEGGTTNGAYQSLVRLQLLLMVPGGVGLILLAEPGLLVISPQYLDAAPIVWVLTPCLFSESMLTTAHNALMVHERLGTVIVSRLVALVTVVALAFWLPAQYGLIGMALTFGVARVAAGLWVTLAGMRLLSLRWPWRFTLRVSVAAAIMGVAVAAMRDLVGLPTGEIGLVTRLGVALQLLALAAIGALIFLLALRLLGGLDPADRAQMLKWRLPFQRVIQRLI